MIDEAKVKRCRMWLMCCQSKEFWTEMINAVKAEVEDLPEDDETRVMVRKLAVATKAELDG